MDPYQPPDNPLQEYALLIHEVGGVSGEVALQWWMTSYAAYLKGLLPAARDAAIADIGCGRGILLQVLRQQGYTNLHGVDLNPELTAMAREVCERVETGDATQYLAARAESFDLILAIDLIEHLRKEDAMNFLRACHRALVPAGRLVLQTPNAESPWGMTLRYGDITHETCYTPDSLLALLRLFGFGELKAIELGPVPNRAGNTLRWLAWKLMRILIMAWNRLGTGFAGSGVYTRAFMATGIKARD